MAFPKLMLNALSYPSYYNRTRQVGRRSWSFLSGSRYGSSPLDDQENADVISDLLVYERRQQVKKNINTENISSAKTKKTVAPQTSKTPRVNKKSSAVNDAGEDQTEVLNLMKAVKTKSFSYIIDSAAADTIVKHVKKDLQPGDIIAEANLGAGILTKALLENTDHKIIGYEPNTEFLMHLRTEYQQYASRLELHCLDLLKFYWFHILNKREPDREGDADKLAQLLKPLPVRDANGVSHVKIVSTVSDSAFFHRLTLSFTFQCCFYKDVFPVFYICIPEKVYGFLFSDSANMLSRRLRLPLQYYFDLEHLDTIPRSSFYSARLKRKRNKQNEEEPFHLVKLSPKEDVHETIPVDELEMFHYFIRCMNRTRAGESLIFRMEKWLPGCGIDYIKNGFRMFTHPKQLTPVQLLEAYRLFIGLPAFKECMFHHHCENWSVQFGLKDDEVPQLEEDENIDESVEDKAAVVYDTDEDVDAFTNIKGKRYWRDNGV